MRVNVILQWLIDDLGVRDEDLFQGIAQTEDGAFLKQRTRVAQSFVEGRVCKQCNNGWMSDLEKQVRRFLTDLMTGQRTLHALGAEERLVLGPMDSKDRLDGIVRRLVSHATCCRGV
jgi:hypothetical protein